MSAPIRTQDSLDWIKGQIYEIERQGTDSSKLKPTGSKPHSKSSFQVLLPCESYSPRSLGFEQLMERGGSKIWMILVMLFGWGTQGGCTFFSCLFWKCSWLLRQGHEPWNEKILHLFRPSNRVTVASLSIANEQDRRKGVLNHHCVVHPPWHISIHPPSHPWLHLMHQWTSPWGWCDSWDCLLTVHSHFCCFHKIFCFFVFL